MDELPRVPDEGEDAVETSGLKDGPGLSGADEFEHLDALFGQILGCSVEGNEVKILNRESYMAKVI